MANPDLRIAEALSVLKELGMPPGQHNDRTAICLLALLDLKPREKWANSKNPMLGIRGILDFSRQYLGRNYAENSRESIRKHSVKQLVAAGLVLHNPDKPDRAVNSSGNCYQVEDGALALLRQVGSKTWKRSLDRYLASRETLAARYARKRNLHRIPVRIKRGLEIKLSAGRHSTLIRSIIEEFGPCFVPHGELVYVGDTGSKWNFFDENLLGSLGVKVSPHGKMPDVLFFHPKKNWLVIVEAVSSSGPVDSGRHSELAKLFKNSSAGLVYVTAFPDRGAVFRRFLAEVAWETEVWCASDPTHLIHFDGIRFLGPYAK